MTSNARLIAELQAVSLATRLFGLDRLPEVMARDDGDQAAGNEADRRSKQINPALSANEREVR